MNKMNLKLISIKKLKERTRRSICVSSEYSTDNKSSNGWAELLLMCLQSRLSNRDLALSSNHMHENPIHAGSTIHHPIPTQSTDNVTKMNKINCRFTWTITDTENIFHSLARWGALFSSRHYSISTLLSSHSNIIKMFSILMIKSWNSIN